MGAEFILLAVFGALIAAGYYSFVLFPRQRDFHKRQEMARSLSQGDEIITYGGLIGKVVDIDSDLGIAYVEIAEGIVVRFVTASIMQQYDPDEIARNAQMEPGKTPIEVVEN